MCSIAYAIANLLMVG